MEILRFVQKARQPKWIKHNEFETWKIELNIMY